MRTRAHTFVARKKESFPRLLYALSATRKAPDASLATCSWLMNLIRSGAGVLMMRHKCAEPVGGE